MKKSLIIILILSIVVTVYLFITRFNTAPDSGALVRADKSDSSLIRTLPVVSIEVTKVAYEIAAFTIEHLEIKKAEPQYRFDQVQLYPIYASAVFLSYHKNLGPYLSLEQALTQDKILITELAGDDQAEVNSIFIENISADTVIILGGEVIRGGKQDRMIVHDFMLKPNSGALNIDVYCVEHNRWQAEDIKASFNITLGLAPADVRQAAKEENSQQQVWEQVEVLYEKYGVEEETKALADALADEDLKGELQPYLEKLGDIHWAPGVVGVITVRGDEIVGCDVFAQHTLFTRYYPALLKSYCGKIHNTTDKDLLQYNEVNGYFKKAFKNEASLQTKVHENGTQLMHGKYRIHAAIY
jgi:hypothetical protein